MPSGRCVPSALGMKTRRTGCGRYRPSDRKSTRLNSSHGYISYAVFCLKKKKNHPEAPTPTVNSEIHGTVSTPPHVIDIVSPHIRVQYTRIVSVHDRCVRDLT